jgi:RNA polymerase sigma-70 factor (ECF subfamily)
MAPVRNTGHVAMDPASRTLVAAALRDPEAFADIIDRHKSMVFSLAFHFFRDRTVTEDIAQEVYLELFRNLARIESDLHLVYWLRQAVTRKCIDQTRRMKHRRHQALDEVSEPGFEPASPDPMLAEVLQKKIATLPEKMRMVIILRFQEDMRLSEISEVLDMPLNTVKTTLRRALGRLKRKVADLELEVAYVSNGR